MRARWRGRRRDRLIGSQRAASATSSWALAASVASVAASTCASMASASGATAETAVFGRAAHSPTRTMCSSVALTS